MRAQANKNDGKKSTEITNQNDEQQRKRQGAREREKQEKELAISRLETLTGLLKNPSEQEREGEHGIHFIACKGKAGARPFQMISNVEMNECQSFFHVAKSVIIFNFAEQNYELDYWLHHKCTTTGSQNNGEALSGIVTTLDGTEKQSLLEKKVGSFRLRYEGTEPSDLCVTMEQYYDGLNKK